MTNFGIFVELSNVYVEGLVHVTALPADYYHYEEPHHRLIGERTRQIFALGDKLQVRVAAVNLDERKIDLELINTGKKPHRKKSVKLPRKVASAGKKAKKRYH